MNKGNVMKDADASFLTLSFTLSLCVSCFLFLSLTHTHTRMHAGKTSTAFFYCYGLEMALAICLSPFEVLNFVFLLSLCVTMTNLSCGLKKWKQRPRVTWGTQHGPLSSPRKKSSPETEMSCGAQTKDLLRPTVCKNGLFWWNTMVSQSSLPLSQFHISTHPTSPRTDSRLNYTQDETYFLAKVESDTFNFRQFFFF